MSDSTRDRHLLRPSGGGSSAPQASSSVVGLIPPAIHNDIRRCASSSHGGAGGIVTGLVDPSGSGLAAAVYHDDERRVPVEGGGYAEGGADVVAVWAHTTHTLSEDLLPPERAARFVHPEPTSEIDGLSLHAGLVALAPYAGGSGGGGSAAAGGFMSPPSSARRGRGGAATDVPAHSLYVCSPSGLLCLWNDALNLSSSTFYGEDDGAALPPPPSEPDAACRVPLEADEYVTSVASTAYAGASGRSPSSGRRSGDAPVILGTSAGRVWLCVRTNRPLQLRMRPLSHKVGRQQDEGAASSSGSILGWLLGTEGSAAEARDEMDEDPMTTRGGAVTAILPLPRGDQYPAGGAASSARGSESPRKVARTRLSDPTSFLSVQIEDATAEEAENGGGGGLVLCKWTLRSSSDSGAEAGALIESRDFRHVLSVSAVESIILGETYPDVNIAQLDPLRSAVSSDGKCLVVTVCVVLRDDSTGAEEGRLYLLKCSLGGVLDAEGRELDLSLDGARWLDRHSSDAVLDGRIECAGLAVRSAVGVGAGASSSDGGSFILESMFGTGHVAYSVWHDPSSASSSAGRAPAVVSSVRFAPFAKKGSVPPSSDVDLPHDVVPALISGAVADDTATDGVVLVGRSGCVASFEVDFPSSSSSSTPAPTERQQREMVTSPTPSSGGGGREEDVQSLSSHLLSAFASHLRRLDERSRSTPARGGRGQQQRLRRGASADVDLTSSLPPSILTTSSRTLSAAAVLASSALADRGDPTADLASNVLGPYDALLERMDVHASFVNFLVHAGQYKRVTGEGRRGLRDTGEMIAGALASADVLEEEARAVTAAARRKGRGLVAEGGGGGDEEWRATMERFLSTLLDQGVTSLPARLAELQATTEGYSYNDDSARLSSSSYSSTIRHMSSLLCAVLSAALRYREDRSNDLYDVPARVRVPTSAPWTSDTDVLVALTRQLELIGKSSAAASTGASGETSRAVRIQSSALLDGHADLPALERNEALYDAAKRLTVPLVRRACVAEEGEEMALRLSVEHGYFEGVVTICRDNSTPGARSGAAAMGEDRGDGDDSNPFDLARILRLVSTSADENNEDNDDEDGNDPLEVLRNASDYTTDLPFPRYVLAWHADRGLYGTVLDLGNQCPPEILTSYMEEDERMEPYRWIQDVRTNRHDAAADRLLRLANGGTEQGGMELVRTRPTKGDGGINDNSLEERTVALGLGKLAHTLAPSSSDAARQRGKKFEDGLLLAQVQETLRGLDRRAKRAGEEDIDDPAADVPLTATGLIDLAVDSSPLVRDDSGLGGGRADNVKDPERARDDRVAALLAGLAAAETLDRTPEDDDDGCGDSSRADEAGLLWTAAVRDDLDVWRSLCSAGGDDSIAAKALPEEERRAMTASTIFARLAGRYAAAGARSGAGFRDDPEVRENVLSSLRDEASPAGGRGDGDDALGSLLGEVLMMAVAEASSLP